MKRIYIVAPYSGDVEKNKQLALAYTCYVKDHEEHMPICPHIYYDQFCDEETERELIMEYCKSDVRSCSEVWVFTDKLTEGMVAEIEEAKRFSKPIEYKKVPAIYLQGISAG